MWKTFQNNGQLYMIKLTTQNENMEVSLTDLKNIWIQNISDESLLAQFQEMNPLFEIEIEDALVEVSCLVHHISDMDTEVSESSDTLQLMIKSVESEYNMEYKFNLVKAPTETFLKEVTVPLIQTVKHLEEQQKMLSAVVQKKDRELEEYKLEKGEISREDLITDKFDADILEKVDRKLMKNVFGASKSFWESFVEQHGDISATIEDVRTEPWNHIKRKRKVYSSKTTTKKDVSTEDLQKEIVSILKNAYFTKTRTRVKIVISKLSAKFKTNLRNRRGEISSLVSEIDKANNYRGVNTLNEYWEQNLVKKNESANDHVSTEDLKKEIEIMSRDPRYAVTTAVTKRVVKELEKRFETDLHNRKMEIIEFCLATLRYERLSKKLAIGVDCARQNKNKKKKRKKLPAHTSKRLKLSPELANFVGQDVMPDRFEVVKMIRKIIRKRNLYDPGNKAYVICDDDLFKVIGVKRFHLLEMLKYLKKHFIS